MPDLGTDELGSLKEAQLWGSLDTYTGLVPYVLSNSYDTIDELQDAKWIFKQCAYYELNELSDFFAEKIAEWVSSWIGKLINTVLLTLGFDYEYDTSSMKSKLIDFFWGARLAEVQDLFRKIEKTMTYINHVENTYLYQEISKKKEETIYRKDASGLREEVDRSEVSDKKIRNMIQNYDSYKIGATSVADIRMEFRNSRVQDIAELGITTENILEVNPNITKSIEEFNTARDEAHKDFEKMEKEAFLDQMKETVKDDLSNSFFESLSIAFPSTYFMTTIFGMDEINLKKYIQEDTWFQEAILDFQTIFENLKTQTDPEKIKKGIDNYYALLKEIATTSAGISEIVDENWDIGISVFNSFNLTLDQSIKNFNFWITLIGEWGLWNTVKWAFWTFSGVATIGWFASLLVNANKQKPICNCTGRKII